MAWIESHQELGRHPKLIRLARKLGVSRPAAVGHLQYLWWWALDYAPDGDLTPLDAEILADACLWDGDPNDLWSALCESGFIDEDGDRLRIHDWHEYQGRLIEKRAATKEQKRRGGQARAETADREPDGKFAKSAGPAPVQQETTYLSTNSQQNSSSQPAENQRNPANRTQPYLTVPNRTQPNHTQPPGLVVPERGAAQEKILTQSEPSGSPPRSQSPPVQPQVSEKFKDEMRQEYGNVLSDVDAVVNRALDHKSALAYRSTRGWEGHVRKWLAEDAAKPRGQPRASPQSSGAGYLEEYRRRRGHLPWENGNGHHEAEEEGIEIGDEARAPPE